MTRTDDFDKVNNQVKLEISNWHTCAAFAQVTSQIAKEVTCVVATGLIVGSVGVYLYNALCKND